MRMEIYKAILSAAALSEEHRKELSESRGFSDVTIERFKFGSCKPGQWLPEESLRDAYSEKELVESGVFVPDGKEIRLSTILSQNRIIVPYLDSAGEPYHLRFSLPKSERRKGEEQAKMLGFAGVPIEIYQEMNLTGKTFDIVLTEGEFKAAAGMQYGIPTVAIPGISSFFDKHFQRLVEFLKSKKVKRIYVLFDNEEKGDPQSENYKENPSERYYTPLYASLMAWKLGKAGFEMLVAWFPDEWRVNGKADLDGSLALGRKTAEILKILSEAKPRDEFIHSLPSEAREVISRKTSQFFHRSAVKRDFNRYVAYRQRGNRSVEEVISNFVIRVMATHETREGVRRAVEFIDENGRRSGVMALNPEEMSGPDSFRTFCLSKGDFVWRGTLEDLLTVWESEFLMQDEGRTIRETDRIGWVEEEKGWIFQNVFIKEDGTVLRPDKDGIFWLDKKGLKPSPIASDGSVEGIPSLCVLSKLEKNEILKKFSETIGEIEAALLLGWVNAVAFMEEVFSICNSFPFLFVTGQWQSGKSTVADLTASFFGLENAVKAISQTTPVAIQRCLAYYSSLPTVLDEYRNTKDVIQSRNGFLRNAYNRQSSGKGTRDSGILVREAKIRGTLIVVGEETPKDGALWSRFVTLYLTKKNRKENHYKWLMQNRFKLSSHFYDLLVRKNELRETFLKAFEEKKEAFLKQGLDDRIAFNYAAITAGFEASFGAVDVARFDSLVSRTHEMQEEFGDERVLNVFYEDLLALATRDAYKIGDYVCVSDSRIFLYFHGLHQIWSEQNRKTRGEEAFKESSVRAYLKEESGFLDSNFVKQINGILKKCIVFDYESAPEAIRNLTKAEKQSNDPSIDEKPF